MTEKDNDIYNSIGRLDSIKHRMATSYPNQNGKTVISFLEALRTNGLSPVRTASIGWHAFTILGMIEGKNLKDLERKDIEPIISQMQNKDWGSETRKMFVSTVKRLTSFAKQGIIVNLSDDQQYSPEVAWLHPRRYTKKNENTTLENRQGFTEEEVEKLLSVVPEIAQDYDRDYLFILLTYESGARTAESIKLRLQDIEIDEKHNTAYILFRSSGKSMPRKVPILLAYRRLVDYISKHALRKNPNSFLFYSKKTQDNKVSYVYVASLIRRLCKKAEIRHRSLYKFRHSRAQNLLSSGADIKTVQKMMGHTNIKTTAIYLSTIDKDIIKAVRKERGLTIDDDEEKKKLELKKCPRCQRIEDPLADRCGACGTFLDAIIALKYEKVKEKHSKKQEREYQNGFKELRKDYDELKQLVLRLIENKKSK